MFKKDGFELDIEPVQTLRRVCKLLFQSRCPRREESETHGQAEDRQAEREASRGAGPKATPSQGEERRAKKPCSRPCAEPEHVARMRVHRANQESKGG